MVNCIFGIWDNSEKLTKTHVLVVPKRSSEQYNKTSQYIYVLYFFLLQYTVGAFSTNYFFITNQWSRNQSTTTTCPIFHHILVQYTVPSIPKPQTQTSNLKPQTSNLKPHTNLKLKPQTSYKPTSTSSLEPQTSNPKPQTSNLKPQTLTLFEPFTPHLSHLIGNLTYLIY